MYPATTTSFRLWFSSFISIYCIHKISFVEKALIAELLLFHEEIAEFLFYIAGWITKWYFEILFYITLLDGHRHL